MKKYWNARTYLSFAFPFQIMPTSCSLRDGRRQKGEITCLVRFILVPEVMKNDIAGKDSFYRLPSHRL